MALWHILCVCIGRRLYCVLNLKSIYLELNCQQTKLAVWCTPKGKWQNCLSDLQSRASESCVSLILCVSDSVNVGGHKSSDPVNVGRHKSSDPVNVVGHNCSGLVNVGGHRSSGLGEENINLALQTFFS